MALTATQPAQPIHTEPNPAGNWPYPYDNTDEQ